jgi:hypothetical protein
MSGSASDIIDDGLGLSMDGLRSRVSIHSIENITISQTFRKLEYFLPSKVIVDKEILEIWELT